MKRMLRIGGLALATATLAATAWAGKGHHGPGKPPARDLGTEVLGPGDGWAAFGPGTTGGAAASADQIHVVTNRRELIAALNDGRASSTSPANASAAPKIIYVQAVIDASVDAHFVRFDVSPVLSMGVGPSLPVAAQGGLGLSLAIGLR